MERELVRHSIPTPPGLRAGRASSATSTFGADGQDRESLLRLNARAGRPRHRGGAARASLDRADVVVLDAVKALRLPEWRSRDHARRAPSPWTDFLAALVGRRREPLRTPTTWGRWQSARGPQPPQLLSRHGWKLRDLFFYRFPAGSHAVRPRPSRRSRYPVAALSAHKLRTLARRALSTRSPAAWLSRRLGACVASTSGHRHRRARRARK